MHIVVFYCSCSTTIDHTLDFTAVDSPFPISLTKNFIAKNGILIEENEYTVVRHFELDKEIIGSIKKGSDKVIEVDLSDDLKKLLDSEQGDAIVNLKIDARQIVRNDEVGLFETRIIGRGWLIAGGTFILMGAILPEESTTIGETNIPLNMGLGFSIAGGSLYSYSKIRENKGTRTWYFTIEGDVITLN